MYRVNRHRLLWLVPLGIVLLGFIIVLLFAKPAAPKKIDLFAGPEGSLYHSYAQKYAELLGEKGVEVNIVQTSGSMENLRSLASDENPAAAFALSGVDGDLEDTTGIDLLESLGCLSYQPFWLFVRSDAQATKISDLSGLRVALGPPEYDARAIANVVLADNGIEDQIIEPTPPAESADSMADALIRGEFDAAFVVGQPHSSVVSRLLESDLVGPVPFERTAAYTLLHPELAEVVLPEGLVDMARNIPEEDLHLLSPADNLVVRSDLNPAVVDLLLDAARSIHREPTLLAPRGTFPNMRHVSLPLHKAAVHFYEEGPSPIRKYLPYWLATLISRFALIVAQVGAVVLVILKGIPAIIRMRFSMKTLSLYRRMERLEKELRAGADWEQSVAEVKDIERETADVKAPRAQLSQYLELRQNLHDLRERLDTWHEENHESV